MKSLMLAVFLLQLGSICFVVADNEEDDVIVPPEPETSNTYSVFISKVLRPGKGFTITVTLSSALTEPLDISAALEYTEGSEVKTIGAAGSVSPGETKVISTDSDNSLPADYAGGTFTLKVVGVDAAGKTIFSDSTSDFELNTKTMTILIQSDKGIYQPGQEVHFRALVLGYLLKPFETAPVTSCQIMAPDATIVQQNTNMPLKKGVAEDSMRLISQPQMGIWTIKCTANGQEASVNFEVKEYTLPKFEVGLSMDISYMTDKDATITGEVSAMYTFGQPVKGSGKVYAFTQTYTWDGTPWGQNLVTTDDITFTLTEGKFAFSFTQEQVADLLGKYPSDPKTIEVYAEVTDKQSREKFNETTTFDYTTKGCKFEKIMTPETYKPQLEYEAYIKFTRYDGSPLADGDVDCTPYISVSYVRDYPGPSVDQPEDDTLPENYDITDIVWDQTGLGKIKLTAPDSDQLGSISFQPKYKTENEEVVSEWPWSWTAKKFKSASNNFIQVSSADDSLNPDAVASINIKATTEMTEYTVLVVARGMTVITERVVLLEPSTEATYNFMVTDEMVPKGTVIVMQHLPDEIVSDSLIMNGILKLRNDVTISLSSTNVDAGTDITLRVKASAESYIGLLAVDQSVEILKKGNAITKDLVSADLDKYDDTGSDSGWYPGLWRFGRWSNSADSSEIFEDAGVIYLTDFTVYDAVDDYIIMEDMFFDGPVMAAAAPVNEVFKTESAAETTVKKTKVRTEFPETWIWAHGVAFEDGEYEQIIKVPDTITSWIVSAFAVSDTTGLGISANDKLTVFRKFFVSVTTPASIIRNDHVTISVTVYNYHDKDVDVKLTLTPDATLYINTTHIPAYMGIAANDARTLKFHIKGLGVGTAHVIVTARANATSFIAQDSMDKTIRIKPEGVQLIKTNNDFIQQTEEEEGTVKDFSVFFPESTIPDSEFVKLMLFSDVIGNSLENIDHLIRMPYGCGEQNMVTFSPNVYAKEYLEKSGKITAEQKSDLRKNMVKGYNNQLRYQWDNGAFSAFGQPDYKSSTGRQKRDSKEEGSTWLTAFVTRVFGATVSVDSDIVDFNVIAKSLAFIIGKQNEDGVFVEDGKVIHREMQGNVNSDQTMTAYCLIALTERAIDFPADPEPESLESQFNTAVEKAIAYLDTAETSDLYSSILVYYAFELVGHSKADELFTLIDAQAKSVGNKKYWTNVEGEELVDGQNPTSVEMTSYMLLANIKKGRDISESIPIVTWLLSQMTPSGGFGNTQDTVVGIQALAGIANEFGNPSLSVMIEDQDGSIMNYDLTEENSIVVKTFVLPVTPGEVKVTITGNGPIVVQFSRTYNLLPEDLPTTSDIEFEIEVEGTTLKACGKLSDENSHPTGMVVIEVELYEGFDVDTAEIQSMNDVVQRAEIRSGEDAEVLLAIYLDSISSAAETCVFIPLHRNLIPVGFQEKRICMVYDYYNQEESIVRKSYALAGVGLDAVNTCDFCEACCNIDFAGTGGGAGTIGDFYGLVIAAIALLAI